MPERYPGYDVLAKRDTPSWNDKTREVIDRRIAVPRGPRFLDEHEFATLGALADRIVPQPEHRAPVPVAALIDERLLHDQRDGYRHAKLPPLRRAWRTGLRALGQEAQRFHGRDFQHLFGAERDALLRAMSEGKLNDPAWRGMPPNLFFSQRVIPDIVSAYYSHPTAWNEIGFGGPASPRGYVRMGFNRRDPWEGAEAHGGDEERVTRENQRVG